MAPPVFDEGKCFRELFEHEDGWTDTRSDIDVLMYADHHLNRQFSEDDLRTWFLQIQEGRLKFALEVGPSNPGAISEASRLGPGTRLSDH